MGENCEHEWKPAPGWPGIEHCVRCGARHESVADEDDDAWPPNPAWLIEHGTPASYFVGDGDWCNNPNHAFRYATKEAATAKAETMPIEGIRVAEHLWQ